MEMRGLYQHFKGDLYYCEGLAQYTETGDLLVVYRNITQRGEAWCRPLSQWNETVRVNGQEKQRFRRIDDARQIK